MNSFINDQSPAGDFETITVSSTAIGPTSSKAEIVQTGGFHKRAIKAFITVESNSVRMRFDGTSPTASVGHLLANGDSVTIQGESNVSKLKFIRVTNDATIQVTYFYNL